MDAPTFQRNSRLVVTELIAEFGERIHHETIARIAHEELLILDRAGVRDFVPEIARRLAQCRLQGDLDPAARGAGQDVESLHAATG